MKQRLKIDHVSLQKSGDWKNKGFFMRYQEIELNSHFYDKLQCSRTQGKVLNDSVFSR